MKLVCQKCGFEMPAYYDANGNVQTTADPDKLRQTCHHLKGQAPPLVPSDYLCPEWRILVP